jgi:translation initiation factor IF-2
MDKRLVKVAKELNVGTSTIVDHLISRGFEIDNKPTAKITEEMYADLLKEFQGSIAVKEQADQLIIGNRPGTVKEEPVKEARVKETKPAEIKPTPEPEGKEDTTSHEPAEDERSVSAPKLKVIGKIDLDADKKKKAEKDAQKKREKEEEQTKLEQQKEPQGKEEVVSEEIEEEDFKVSDVEVTEIPQELLRAETPQLKGLKILGKIDTDKLKKQPKKKEEPVEKKKEVKAKPVPDDAQGDRNKRRRKRKKVTVDSAAGMQASKKAKPKEEVKEVSQKEIEDKIKATMARLNIGSKNKRQKIRRDNRERLREKNEMQFENQTDQKLQVTEFISVSELASLLNVPVIDVITTCMNVGVIVSINQRLDAEIIELVASEFGQEIEFISAEDTDLDDVIEVDDSSELEHRAPIVTVMGHVDHGKTSLLDYIRSANVASGEAGGITQHIGAYEVQVNDKKITFLDTPGHEAFTAMRARGAKVTDVAVIIIAADDNIMPQTREAISHAQAANVPIVFAINKIDKPGADPERIKNELAQMNLMVEEWGGKYQSQDISAKTGLNIDQLCEKILLEAELLELTANPQRKAVGTVLEASLEKGRGYVCKVLVQNGTLKIGDPLVAGEFAGKVKAMFNERGKKVKEAGPATPVLVLGLSGAPQAGEIFKVTASESEAKGISAKRAQINREQATRATKRISLDEIGRRLALGTFKELNLIVKGDVDGSIEALSDALLKLSVETIQVKIIHKAVGQIIESDVLLASASDAIIIGFQVRPSSSARKLAEKEGVEIKLYSIIYEAIEEIKMAMEGMLEPTKEEKILGQIEVREVFKISKVGTVAGGYVEEGKVNKNSHVRLIRDGIVIYPTKEGVHGEISSLKRFKEDVKEVRNGFECGISIKNFNDLKVGDYIEAYEITEVKQTLS